jgi:hypothetical protein
VSDKEDAPVVGDENFVNVDPDFANWSNEVDKPLPLPEVEDYNLPEGYRNDNKDDNKEDDKDDEKKDEKPSTVTPAVAPAVKPAAK